MATLILVKTSRGVVGRCDERCYDAKQPECECCCGGANHGTGLSQALDNTRDLAEEIIKEHCPGAEGKVTIKRPPVQGKLFTDI